MPALIFTALASAVHLAAAAAEDPPSGPGGPGGGPPDPEGHAVETSQKSRKYASGLRRVPQSPALLSVVTAASRSPPGPAAAPTPASRTRPDRSGSASATTPTSGPSCTSPTTALVRGC